MQLRQQLISTVLPFDALMFKSHRAVASTSRRGLEVLEDCARALLLEVRLEGYAVGLEVEVQVTKSVSTQRGLKAPSAGCARYIRLDSVHINVGKLSTL